MNEDDIYYDDSLENQEDELYEEFPEYEPKEKKVDPIEKSYKEEELKIKEKTESFEECEFDEVVGGRDKKPVLSLLNQRSVSKHELDEIFCTKE
tara:strand:- start:260 stop:541 length:282 start_codon:yes stop_codon:yes gene_type:complete